MESFTEDIQKAIAENTICLFTKGTREFPRCGFSHRVIEVFKALDVPFHTYDVLAHPQIRQDLSALSGWPTTPQVFIGGEFIGGGDVVWEMFQNGELRSLVDEALARAGGSES